MWQPRSVWHQEEYPRPRDSWAERVRRSLARLSLVPQQSYLPWSRRGWTTSKGNVGAVVRPQTVSVPVVHVTGYWGELPYSMQPQLEIPHPTGLPNDAPVAAEGRRGAD